MHPILPTSPGFSFTFLFIDIIFGLIGLTLILVFHGSALNHIVMRFERLTKANLEKKQHNWIFLHFYVAFIFFALIHISEIFIWSGIIIWLNLIPEPSKPFSLREAATPRLALFQTFCPQDGKVWRSL